MSPNLLHRAVVFISGQGDEMATPYAGCNFNCSQGRICDCDTELTLDIPPDDTRVIKAPPPIEVDPAYRARVMRMAVVACVAAWSALAGLLGIANAVWMP